MQHLLLVLVKPSAWSADLALRVLTKRYEILLRDDSAVLCQCAGTGADDVKCRCKVGSTDQADRGLISTVQRSPQQEHMACWSTSGATLRATEFL